MLGSARAVPVQKGWVIACPDMPLPVPVERIFQPLSGRLSKRKIYMPAKQ